MNALTAWFQSRNITSHTVAAFVIAAAGLVVSDQQVRTDLVAMCIHHPDIATGIIALAGVVSKYSTAASSRGDAAPPSTPTK